MRSLALAIILLGLAGCLAPPSASQRLADAAIEMNSATRFGRMDLAIERVGPDARREFARRHAGWGAAIRVVDLDFGGFDLVKRDEAEVHVNVMWQRQDEAVVRVTRIVQRWRDDRGTWQLIGEERRGGDRGLLGEPVLAGEPASAPAPAPSAPRRVGFQRRVIRGE